MLTGVAYSALSRPQIIMPINQDMPATGQMMDQPLLISSIIRHADRYFSNTPIVSRGVDGVIHRYTYGECYRRSLQLASALESIGVKAGTRVGTIAWNGYRHLELYFGVAGSGAVVHTINPRFPPDQVAYIINHAEDTVLVFDIDFLPLVEDIARHCSGLKAYVALCERAQMPSTSSVPNLLCYEEFITSGNGDYEWPVFDERAASGLCYTSGTTGSPKGVLYSHRSTVLHSYAVSLPDAVGVSSREVMLPIVPMYHVHAWGLPYAATMNGAKLVLPGPFTDGNSLYDFMESEGVTFAAGVPTVWQGLLSYVEENGFRFSSLKRANIGGATCPPLLMDSLRDKHGVEVIHSWGMTETSPLGTTCRLQGHHAALSTEQKNRLRRKHGLPVFGIDIKITDDTDTEIPWDGWSPGNLMVKGHWVVSNYFKEEKSRLQNGWFPTGDVATVDREGYMQITDRSKDVVKSGGEWIGTIDLENVAMSHPAVFRAACVGVTHPKLEERPILIVEARAGSKITKQELLGYYADKVATWWIPDDVIFVDALPIGATGKVLKNVLRARYKTHLADA